MEWICVMRRTGECGRQPVVGVPQNGAVTSRFLWLKLAAVEPHSRPINALDMTDNKTWMCPFVDGLHDESVGAPDEGILLLRDCWPDVP